MRKPYRIEAKEGEDPDKNYSYYSDKGYSYYSDKGYSYYSDKDYSKYSYSNYSYYSDKAYSYYSDKENEIVGLDGDLEQIKDLLIYDSQMQLKALSIVGMGGIGKTTLARRIFNHPSIVHHFHVCLWVTVTQNYQVRKMLRSLLKGLHEFKSDDVLFKRDDAGLGETLYKKLKGRTYLIVMDDVWSTKALDEVRIYFPNDGNRSRILVTTRLVNVATYLNSEVSHHMNFLSTEDGCELLHKKVFGKEEFPSDLEQIGREIVRECQGLPLAISVVAGILRKISMTLECWTEVAESVASHLTEDPKACLDIIGFSYKHLPSHLKACFLYMGAFPADSEIPSQKLIRLWIAEGFLDASEIINPEKVAEDWLEDLTERHLILVRKNSLGRIRTCHMHGLLREFCLREAKLQNFLHHYPDLDASAHEGTQYHTRVILNPCNCPYNLSAPHIYSLLCHHENLYEDFFLRHKDFKLLTVLDFYVSHLHCFPSDIVQLVNLRYLALFIHERLPPLISNLGKLQVLILNYGLGGTLLPQEIWKLSQLRHLQCNDFCILPDPSTAENAGKGLTGLYNLQTLSKLSLCSCSVCVIAALPNLKKVRICEIDEADKTESYLHSCNLNSDNHGSISTINNLRDNLGNLAKLHQLESLKLTFLDTFSTEPTQIPQLDSLPLNIKKLTLSFSYLPWEYMNILCMLPNLEVLKLRPYAFIGQEWEQHEEGFNRLKLLLIETTDLEHWECGSDHFPCLEHLVLKFCKRLQCIPLDVGAIPTLKLIEVHECSHFAAESAEEIHREQKSLGNDVLDVHINMTGFLYDQLHSEEKSMSSVHAIPHPSDLHPQGNLSSVHAIPHPSGEGAMESIGRKCRRSHGWTPENDDMLTILSSRKFEKYFEYIWKDIPQEKKKLFTHVDSSWFNIYSTSQKEKVLNRVKNKCILSKPYVLVPIVWWSHWTLLILCNFDEDLELIKPCMFLLDSWQAVEQNDKFLIRQFVKDLLIKEGRFKQAERVHEYLLLIPTVPQQHSGGDCGYYVLYYAMKFMQETRHKFSFSTGYSYFMTKNWFALHDMDQFKTKLFEWNEQEIEETDRNSVKEQIGKYESAECKIESGGDGIRIGDVVFGHADATKIDQLEVEMLLNAFAGFEESNVSKKVKIEGKRIDNSVLIEESTVDQRIDNSVLIEESTVDQRIEGEIGQTSVHTQEAATRTKRKSRFKGAQKQYLYEKYVYLYDDWSCNNEADGEESTNEMNDDEYLK